MVPNYHSPLVSFQFRVCHQPVPHSGTEDLKALLFVCQSMDGHHIPNIDESLGGIALGGGPLVLVELQHHHPMVLGEVLLQDVPSLSVLGRREEGESLSLSFYLYTWPSVGSSLMQTVIRRYSLWGNGGLSPLPLFSQTSGHTFNLHNLQSRLQTLLADPH